jgi:hypothetical protein
MKKNPMKSLIFLYCGGNEKRGCFYKLSEGSFCSPSDSCLFPCLAVILSGPFISVLYNKERKFSVVLALLKYA